MRWIGSDHVWARRSVRTGLPVLTTLMCSRLPLSRRPLGLLIFGSLLLLLFAACGPAKSSGPSTRDGAVPPLADRAASDAPLPPADSGPGSWADAPGPAADAPPEPTCGNQSFTPEKVGDPDLLILMDTSSSMLSPESGPSKYEQTSSAISRVVDELAQPGAPVHFGLELFPQDGDCAVTRVNVPVAAGNAAEIKRVVQGVTPRGNTPAAKAVQVAQSYLLGLTDGRSKYILIATDGQPNCETVSPIPKRCKTDADCDQRRGEKCEPIPILGGICEGGSDAMLRIAEARDHGIRTFVVGIAINGGDEMLEAMAEAGGTARTGSPSYYPVGSEDDLVATLRAITQTIISCTFELSKPPPDDNYVTVRVGGQDVPRDRSHQNGWDITGTTLEFFGDACRSLQANPTAVEVTFGCKPPA